MSIEARIREGLRANTQHLQPALEHDEEVVMSKVEQRRRDRRIRYAGAGALVAAAVVAGAVWLPSAIEDSSTSQRPSPAGPDDVGSVPPLPMTGAVEPGTYEAQFNGGGSATPRAVVDVPAGFKAWAGSVVLERNGVGAVGFWTVSKVKQDPCDFSASAEEPGPSVADLAAALRSQERTRASRPVATSLGGYDGLYLELTTPERGAPDTCPGNNRFALWTIGSGGLRYTGPDEVLSMWILDVDGQQLIVNAEGSEDPEAGPQVDAMIDSVRIVDPEP